MGHGTILGLTALAVAATCAKLWFDRIRRVDLPEDRTTFVAGFLVAAALGIGAFAAGAGWIGAIAAVPAILIGLFFPFSVAISRQKAAPNAIAAGDTIPHFTAVDDQREPFDSGSLHGHLVLIKFFRAHW